jgi:translocation and assembly module TamB
MSGTSVSDWDLDIRLSDYELTEFEDFYARLDGDLSVTAAEIDAGATVPRIFGDLTVEEGEYYFSPDAGGDGGFIPPTDRPAWIMDVEVEIPNDFWIKGDVVQAELQGDLSVRRGREGLSVLGTLTTLRGKFSVYHNSMRISKGEFRFIDVKSFRNAYIDLEASSTVLDERVDLRATGYLDKLDISATSESGWSEQQIFEALLLRRGVASDDQAGNKFFSDAFLQSWGTALVNRFGDNVARELHLDQFGVEVAGGEEIDPIASTWVTFGKYVSSSVYVQYSQSLGSLYGDLYGDRQRFTPVDLAYPERQLSVEYRFSNRLSIEGETGTINGLEYFDFDVKFRFGY